MFFWLDTKNQIRRIPMGKSRPILNDTHPSDDKMRLFRLLGVENARL